MTDRSAMGGEGAAIGHKRSPDGPFACLAAGEERGDLIIVVEDDQRLFTIVIGNRFVLYGCEELEAGKRRGSHSHQFYTTRRLGPFVSSGSAGGESGVHP
jgi:hypothetical protein